MISKPPSEHIYVFSVLSDILCFFYIGDETAIFYHTGENPTENIYLFTPHDNMRDFLSLLNQQDVWFSSKDTVFLKVRTCNVFMFSYPFSLVVEPYTMKLKVSGRYIELKVSSLEDVLCMKFIAVLRKGKRKDIDDVRFLIRYLGFGKEEVISLMRKKYGDINLNFDIMRILE